MKLAYITPSTIPSLAANSIQVMKVCQAMAQNGVEVRLYAAGNPQPTPTWEKLAEQYGLTREFEIQWLPAAARMKRYDFAWQALRKARAWGAAAVYTRLPQAAWLGLWMKSPMLYEIHDLPSGRFGPWLVGQIVRHRGEKRLLFITHALQKAYERRYGLQFSAQTALVAPDGVDLERYQDLPKPEEARRQLGLPEGLTTMTSGHLYAGRGAPLFLALAGRLPQINFLWVGGRAEDVARWREESRKAGLSNLRFSGFIPNAQMPLYQAAADFLLMPYERSISGSSGGNIAEIYSPLKMFEYLAAGRAILTSDLPVLREVLNEQNAAFCPPEDADVWQNTLQGLIDDPRRRGELAEAARRTAAHYSWQARARKSLEDFPAS